jgi:hypothetical protein
MTPRAAITDVFGMGLDGLATRPQMVRSERRLCRRNLILGEASEGAVDAPSDS